MSDYQRTALYLHRRRWKPAQLRCALLGERLGHCPAYPFEGLQRPDLREKLPDAVHGGGGDHAWLNAFLLPVSRQRFLADLQSLPPRSKVMSSIQTMRLKRVELSFEKPPR